MHSQRENQAAKAIPKKVIAPFSEKELSLILADDENGARQNPVTNPKHSKDSTSTNCASNSQFCSTVTDGEAG